MSGGRTYGMKTFRAGRTACIAGVLSVAALAAAAREPFRCLASPAVVSGASAAEVAIVCDGARAATEFLLHAGVTLPAELPIDVVPTLPGAVPRDAAGCYATTRGRVLLVPLQTFEQRGTWLGVTADGALYRSMAAHEVAHAIAGCQKGPRPLTTLAHEVLANVTMYATMQPALRAQLLAAHPGTGYDHERQIGILDYVFDPARFGADVYRYWAAQRDGAAFLRRVLDGTAIVELESD
jgi:hypothetical protein